MNEPILIVDDIADIRLLIKRILKANGFDSIEAENGKEALKILKSRSDIKLVLLDTMMNVMDGYTTMEKLKELSLEEEPTVCFLTAKRGKDDVIKATKLGATDYIIKPIDSVILIDKVKSLLNIDDESTTIAERYLNFPANIENLPVSLKVTVIKISELQLELESSIDFKENKFFDLSCDALNEVFEPETTVNCRVLSSEKNSGKFSIKATFIGLPETVSTKLRKFIHNQER